MDPLDRELSAALDVDLSPAFLARVRARVASEPPLTWRIPQLMLVAGVTAVAIGIAMSLSLVDQPTPIVAIAPAAAIATATAPVAAPASSASAVITPARRYRTRPQLNPIQLVSIADLPAEPIGDIVPQMAFDVVTMTGVHP